MQTDSRLLGGDSGGPLFDFNGRLIAIHSRISQQPDQNFHVPIECFHANWDFFKNQQMITYEKMQDGGFLGVSCEDIEQGLIVREVIPDTAAENAGIRSDDLLLAVNGEIIDSREEFIILISSFEPKEEVKVTLKRNNQEFSLKVTLGIRPSAQK